MLRHFHDATLFFDEDGTPYVFFGTGEMWQQIGTRNYHMVFDYRRFFMGTKFAIFYYATKRTGGHVDIDSFDYQRSSVE